MGKRSKIRSEEDLIDLDKVFDFKVSSFGVKLVPKKRLPQKVRDLYRKGII